MAALPYPFQCLSLSPYYDSSLFLYDMKHASCIEKPKTCPEYPLKFFDRKNQTLAFQLSIQAPPHAMSKSKYGVMSVSFMSHFMVPRKFSNIIFHPTDPFVITCIHAPQRPSITNFHYYSGPH
jgi:de-etiolated-1